MEETAQVNQADSRSLLTGLLTQAQLESETGWGWRTILRREADGLPVIVIGRTKLYPADRVREWIMSHERRHEPVRRGRPSANRAA